MYSYFWKALLTLAILLLMASCSEAPSTTTAAAQSSAAAAPVSGKTAFWAMYKSAYSWSNDIVPLKLESKDLPGVKNDGGDAGMWSATFGSYNRHQAIVITYAVAAHPPEIYKGNNISNPVPWGGPAKDVMPFQSSDLQVDSDAAYKTALAQADAWLKKHPDKEASLLMGNNPTRFSTPVWYVQWGDNKSGYFVFVNTKTGVLAKPGT
jgi:hypothetical protein